MKQFIIAIDFDGTIVEHKFPSIGPLIPGAKEMINNLCDDGHQIIIWTTRSSYSEIEVVEFLQNSGINYHYINQNAKKFIDLLQSQPMFGKYEHEPRKIYADIYIDDRSLLPLPSWGEIYKIIKKKLNDQG